MIEKIKNFISTIKSILIRALTLLFWMFVPLSILYAVFLSGSLSWKYIEHFRFSAAAIGIITIYVGYYFYMKSVSAEFKSLDILEKDTRLQFIFFHFVTISIMIVITFAGYYAMIVESCEPNVNCLSSPKLFSPHESFYLSFVTFTSLGFGDLTPKNNIGRYFIGFQSLLGSFHLVAYIWIVLSGKDKQM